MRAAGSCSLDMKRKSGTDIIALVSILCRNTFQQTCPATRCFPADDTLCDYVLVLLRNQILY